MKDVRMNTELGNLPTTEQSSAVQRSGKCQERRDPTRHEERRRAEPGRGAPGKDKPVPPGYKMTEVGVIPEDWEVKPLG